MHVPADYRNVLVSGASLVNSFAHHIMAYDPVDPQIKGYLPKVYLKEPGSLEAAKGFLDVTRNEATIVLSEAPDQTYLFRPSSQNSKNAKLAAAITYRYEEDRCMNFLINRNAEKKLTLQKKTFNNFDEITDYLGTI